MLRQPLRSRQNLPRCRTGLPASLAIGKEGQNARLAAKLTGWKIDIKSETQAAEEAAAEPAPVEEA